MVRFLVAALGPTFLGWPPGDDWLGSVPKAVETPGYSWALDTDKNILVKWPWTPVPPGGTGPELAATSALASTKIRRSLGGH